MPAGGAEHTTVTPSESPDAEKQLNPGAAEFSPSPGPPPGTFVPAPMPVWYGVPNPGFFPAAYPMEFVVAHQGDEQQLPPMMVPPPARMYPSQPVPPEIYQHPAPEEMQMYPQPPVWIPYSPPHAMEAPSESEAEDSRSDDTAFRLELDTISIDPRTTIMIKNIPNKYTQRNLLELIDQNNKGTYDFFYLPIDFKNKCNLGYAFINFIQPEYIIPLFEEFANRRWGRFNSDKVCELSYARIQGKAGLVSHFRNSRLMFKQEKYRPMVFDSQGARIKSIPFPSSPGGRRWRDEGEGGENNTPECAVQGA
mmetsp:Transcript_70665/g.166602  ORF Transcript_70665/g.166602 Transcript_70665/m.166602 type:complete len:308 (+) Transcript_70665:93-1016(+)